MVMGAGSSRIKTPVPTVVTHPRLHVSQLRPARIPALALYARAVAITVVRITTVTVVWIYNINMDASMVATIQETLAQMRQLAQIHAVSQFATVIRCIPVQTVTVMAVWSWYTISGAPMVVTYKAPLVVLHRLVKWSWSAHHLVRTQRTSRR
jgi:hypothetical protein